MNDRIKIKRIVIDPGMEEIEKFKNKKMATKVSKYKDNLFKNELSFFDKLKNFNVIIYIVYTV